ncbi:hypothetical protein V8V88_02090 [Paenibacillus phytohabitans]|jgi:hypothetical protein
MKYTAFPVVGLITTLHPSSQQLTLACPEETAAWITAALILSTTFLSSTAGNGESGGVLHLHERMPNLQQAVPVPGMSIKNNDKIVIFF